ncbi:MAG: spore coat associated protein CotJA [Clostridiales bacterium]|nr:spore coat associated protein CotJA [Clostridiales bacterium]
MPVLAMAYVPMQRLNSMYEPEDGFIIGTIFPELDKPWMPKGCEK